MEPVPSTVTRTYPPRGPLQQYRFAEGTAFRCFRCGGTKQSKLITVYAGDWSRKLYNGCYGRLLSLYEIKAGTAAEDQRADQVAQLLDQAEHSIFSIAESSASSQDLKSVRDMRDEFFSHLETLAKSTETVTGVTTGFPEI